MNPSVKAAKNALLIKAAHSEMLKALSPLATNVLVGSEDVEDALDEQGTDTTYGTLVPAWNALDSVDELISLLEQTTGKEISDSPAPEPKPDLKSRAQALVADLRALSEWASKKAVALKQLGDEETLVALTDVADKAFNAAMGLEDTLLFEGRDDSAMDKRLISEMRKLAGMLDYDTRYLGEDNRETVRQVTQVNDKYEAFLKKALGKPFKLKLPHLTSGPNKVMIAWKSAKPKGGFMGAYVSMEIEYDAGADLYNIELAYTPADGSKQVTKMVHGVDVDALTTPETMLGTFLAAAKTGKAESSELVMQMRKLAGVDPNAKS